MCELCAAGRLFSPSKFQFEFLVAIGHPQFWERCFDFPVLTELVLYRPIAGLLAPVSRTFRISKWQISFTLQNFRMSIGYSAFIVGLFYLQRVFFVPTEVTNSENRSSQSCHWKSDRLLTFPVYLPLSA